MATAKPLLEILDTDTGGEGSKTAQHAQPVQTYAGTITKQKNLVEKPWTTLFKDNRAPSNGIKLNFVPPRGNTLDFSDRVMPSMVDMWGYCLVGFFTGRFPGLKVVHELKFRWGVKCQIKSHDKGWVIFKFHT
ncbi:unnamed protein product, partial [Cuscuta europaea]